LKIKFHALTVFEQNFQNQLRNALTDFCENYGLGFSILPMEDSTTLFAPKNLGKHCEFKLVYGE